jgi:multimeric flavodoxin WrbA
MNKSGNKVVIIQGSARSDGDTNRKVRFITEITEWDHVDLNEYQISAYDYHHRNRNDDFLPLMRHLTTNYEVFVFATPVYWYAMSGTLKIFFDRFTDLLTIEKDLGRTLRGKSMAVLSCSNGGNLGDDFWIPFREIADYLGMHYLANVHTYQETEEPEKLKAFVARIQ